MFRIAIFCLFSIFITLSATPLFSSKPVVVLIDSDEENAATAKCKLKAVGFKVHLSNNTRQGLTMAQQLYMDHQPVIIATDIEKPVMGGLELIKTCRSHPEGLAEIQIVGMSKILDDCDALMLAGANCFIKTPFKEGQCEYLFQALKNRSLFDVVILVDDNAIFRKIGRNKMMAKGFQVVTASNGVLGLSNTQTMHRNNCKTRNRLACVLTDFNMPELNGQELTLSLRKDKDHLDLPIIGMSTKGEEARPKFLEAGANDFVHKPYMDDALEKTVMNVLQKAKNKK